MRFTLVVLLMFTLPFVGFFIWRAYRGEKANPMPVQNLVITGAVLSVVSMIAMALTSIESGDSDGVYLPQSLEDGEVRPGRFAPDDSQAETTLKL